MNKDVVVKSTVKAQVGIRYPELNLRRTWLKKGAEQIIAFDVLKQAIYDPGIEYMFRTGILYIDDMDVKIALHLEEPDTEEPQNIIVLNEKQQIRYLTVAPIHEFKEMVAKLSKEQLGELANKAVELRITDLQKTNILKDLTQIDILKAIAIEVELEELNKKTENKGK